MSEKPATVPPHMVPEAEALFERLGYQPVANEGEFDPLNEPPPPTFVPTTKWNGLPDGPAMQKVLSGACNLNILAVDIGTTTGWALGLRDGALHGGSQSFAPRRNDGPGQRWLKFAAWLGERARQAGEIHAIYYELVMAHGTKKNPNTIAAHVYGGFEAHLQAWADRNRVRLVGVPVTVIKKAATGKGNADKTAMVAAMRARGHRVADDNHADALALLEYARAQEAA